MRIVISNSSGIPIYEQIKEGIKSSILSGELQEGEMLPSIRQLAKELKVSVITTTRAYNDLQCADQGDQRFRQADEADGQGAMLRISRISSSGPSLSESIHTPCPIRKGKLSTFFCPWMRKRSSSC